MWNNITIRIKSPIYLKRFWPKGANKTENSERIIKEKLLFVKIFCVPLYTHYCLVSIIPTFCKKPKHRHEVTFPR